jgi:biopolymer transport protein TolR
MRDKELFLMADKTLPYGFVVDVMATVQRAGILNVGMITNPQPERIRPAKDREAAR